MNPRVPPEDTVSKHARRSRESEPQRPKRVGGRFSSPFGSMTLLHHQLLLTLRKPKSIWVFGSLLLIGTLGFITVYESMAHTALSSGRVVMLGRELFYAYALLSLSSILLFGPPIGVRTIAQERENDTLDLLLTAPQRPIGFVLSKVTVSVVTMLTAVFGTLPLLALTFIMGGVSPDEFLLLIFSQISLTLIVVSIGIWAGALCRSTTRSLATAYGTLVLVLLLISCGFGCLESLLRAATRIFSGEPGQASRLLLLLPAVYMLALILFVFIAPVAAYLRREVKPMRPRSWRPIRMKGKDSQLWSLLGVSDHGESIPDDTNPIYIAERQRFLLQVARRYIDAPSVLWIGSAMTFLAVAWFRWFPDFLLFVSLFLTMVFTPLVGASALTGERERQTWEALRATLLDARRIVSGKLRLTATQGMIHAGAWYIPTLPLIVFILLFGRIISGVSAGDRFDFDYFLLESVRHFANLTVITATTVFLAAVSIWVSARSRRSFPALMVAYLIAFLFLVGPWIVYMLYPDPHTLFIPSGRMNGLAVLLAVWHAPFLFDTWNLNPKTPMSPPTVFWELYAAHLCLLLTLSATAIADSFRRVRAVHD